MLLRESQEMLPDPGLPTRTHSAEGLGDEGGIGPRFLEAGLKIDRLPVSEVTDTKG